MKLCFLAGANSIHSKRWIKYFADKGHEVHWLSLGIGIDEVIDNTEFYLIKKFPLKVLRPLFYAISVKKILNKIKPDILDVHQVWIDGIVGALSGFHPLIITPWGSDVLIAPKSKLKKPLIKFALKKADLITCDGENTKEAIVDLGINPQKIRRICFGVDIKKFKPEPKDENLKSKLKVANSPIVISLRGLEPLYDLGTLIKAIPLILKEVPNTKFIIAGDGVQKNELINLAQYLNAFDSIKFTGKIPNEEMPKYLNLADIYVSTSLSESGLAASTAEAMACELPVINTNTGDIELWIKNGEGGFVIPVKKPEILAKKIIYLLRNDEERMKFGKVNRKIIEERNNYYREMDKMENIYKNLVCIYER